MSSNQFQEDSFINSIIGEGTHLRGDFELNGLLRVDGDFSGTVKTKGKVLIGSNGRAECTIYGGTIVVGGVVKGNIYATEKVIILSTGMMIGNIRAPRLIIEEGVLFDGTCRIEKTAVSHGEMREEEEKSIDASREKAETAVAFAIDENISGGENQKGRIFKRKEKSISFK